jgi:hypothetical protein
LPLHKIVAKATTESSDLDKICSQDYLFKILIAMFSSIRKSKVNENGKLKLSVKGVKFGTTKKRL